MVSVGMARDSITINEAPKARKRGRISIDVETEPMVAVFDDERAAKHVATAIAKLVARQIRTITARAMPSTIRRRRREGIAGSALFNATGRLAKGVHVSGSGDEWGTVAPQGRLSGDERDLLPQLADHVDAIGDPGSVMRDRDVIAAIEEAHGMLVQKARNSRDAKKRASGVRGALGKIFRRR